MNNMLCPFRKEIVKKISSDGATITVKVNFLECYMHQCQYYNSYFKRCEKTKVPSKE